MKALRFIVGVLALIGLASIGAGVVIVVSFVASFFWIIVLVILAIFVGILSIKESMARKAQPRKG